MGPSALERVSKSLESSLDFWGAMLLAATLLVVIGLVFEYWHEVRDFWERVQWPMSAFPWDRLLTISGGILVTLGVAGELLFTYMASRVETKLRDSNHQIEGLLSAEASNAEREAGIAQQEAARLRDEAALIEESLVWRRLTPHDERLLTERMSEFSGQKVWIFFNFGDVEGRAFAWAIAIVLHDKAGIGRVLSPATLGLGEDVNVPFDRTKAQHVATGILVGNSDNPRSLKAAQVLTKALRDRGFSVTLNPIADKRKTEEISINIESRPVGPQGEAKLKLEELKKQQNSQNSQ